MDHRKADLLADFGLSGANRFNILLIKHNVIGSALGSFGFGCPLGSLRAAEGGKTQLGNSYDSAADTERRVGLSAKTLA